jgi:hypothetical protein
MGGVIPLMGRRWYESGSPHDSGEAQEAEG